MERMLGEALRSYHDRAVKVYVGTKCGMMRVNSSSRGDLRAARCESECRLAPGDVFARATQAKGTGAGGGSGETVGPLVVPPHGVQRLGGVTEFR